MWIWVVSRLEEHYRKSISPYLTVSNCSFTSNSLFHSGASPSHIPVQVFFTKPKFKLKILTWKCRWMHLNVDFAALEERKSGDCWSQEASRSQDMKVYKPSGSRNLWNFLSGSNWRTDRTARLRHAEKCEKAASASWKICASLPVVSGGLVAFNKGSDFDCDT